MSFRIPQVALAIFGFRQRFDGSHYEIIIAEELVE